MAGDHMGYDFFLENNPHRPDRSRARNTAVHRTYASSYSHTAGGQQYGGIITANSYNSESVARDVAAVEDVRPEIHRAPNRNMRKSPPKPASVVKVMFIALIGALLISTVLYGKMQQNKMYSKISDKNAEYELAQSENSRLKSEIEGKMTLKNVEQYVENVLGMRKLDNSQIKYVQTQTDDSVEIVDENKSLITRLKDKFSDLVEYIFG